MLKNPRKSIKNGKTKIEDVSLRYSLLRGLPWLAELDGDPLRAVDRQLADEFFTFAQDMGFREKDSRSIKLHL
eukprot:1793342-Amphidinium_carterae.1